MALMTGSEGLLGVVTEITVRLLPLPADAQALLAAFADVRCGGEAVADDHRRRDHPRPGWR